MVWYRTGGVLIIKVSFLMIALIATLILPNVTFANYKPIIKNLSSNTNVVATYFVVNCRESITLRNAPSVYADEITQIPLGQAVGFIENAGNGFYKINYDGLVGYELAQYLSPNKNGGSSVRYARVVDCERWISLREYPDTNSAALRRIPLGDLVRYFGRVGNGFCRVEYDGIGGYALQAYLELQ